MPKRRTKRDLKAWLGLLERHERCLEVPSEIERVQALALDQPAAGVTSLCTAHKSKGLEFGVVTLADDFPSAETLPHPPKPAGGEDPEGFTYSKTRAPRPPVFAAGFAGVGDRQACAAGQGGSPAAVNGIGALPLAPELSRANEKSAAAVTLPGCPTRSDTSDNTQCCLAVNLETTPPKGGFSWQLGALDPDRRQVVVAHYRHRYPALDWGWLLQALAELRLVGEPRSTVTRFLAGYRLGSAQSLIERFCLDVGLWVVEAEG